MKQIPELNGLRGLAIITPVLHHYGLVHWQWGATTSVKVFFVLSGFLITRSLLDRRERGESLWQFFIERTARIFPVYYALILALWLFTDTPNIGWAACYRYNEVVGEGHGPLGPTWSLAVEEQFYLAAPFVVWYLSRRWATVAACLTIGASIGAIAWLSWSVNNALGAAPMDVTTAKQLSDLAGLSIIGNAPCLLAGVLMATHANTLDARATLKLAIYAVLAGTLACMFIAHHASQNAGNFAPLMNMIQSATTATAIFALALHHHYAGSATVQTILNEPKLHWLARISYGVYLLHVPLLGLTSKAMDYLPRIRGWDVTPYAAIVVTLAVCWASYTWFESRISRWVKAK